MLLLEHDAKTLLRRHGLPCPDGVLVAHADTLSPQRLPAPPWMVKAQVPAGGRGKAGAVRRCASFDRLPATVAALLATTVRGMRVRSCRVESRVDFAHERYLSLSLEPRCGRATVLVCAAGGVEVEAAVAAGVALHRASSAPDAESVVAAALPLLEPFAGEAPALAAALRAIAEAFQALEALLVEVNPLFLLRDGSWLVGDAKLVLDGNALARQPGVARLLRHRRADYPELAVKLERGFDFVVTDPRGEIGLLTTGAGLSMMLMDEMAARGLAAYNFCDIRTGALRDDPQRLIDVLEWICAGRKVRVVFVNIFAGITDLENFARLLVTAAERVLPPSMPVVARLIGPGDRAARAVLAASLGRVEVVQDVESALARIDALLRGRATACSNGC